MEPLGLVYFEVRLRSFVLFSGLGFRHVEGLASRFKGLGFEELNELKLSIVGAYGMIW